MGEDADYESGYGMGRDDGDDISDLIVTGEPTPKPPTHNPWSFRCGRRIDGEPYRDGEHCPICEPEVAARAVAGGEPPAGCGCECHGTAGNSGHDCCGSGGAATTPPSDEEIAQLGHRAHVARNKVRRAIGEGLGTEAIDLEVKAEKREAQFTAALAARDAAQRARVVEAVEAHMGGAAAMHPADCVCIICSTLRAARGETT